MEERAEPENQHPPKDSARVFISYASQDAAVAQKVCAALEAAGFSCWIAPRDVRQRQRRALTTTLPPAGIPKGSRIATRWFGGRFAIVKCGRQVPDQGRSLGGAESAPHSGGLVHHDI